MYSTPKYDVFPCGLRVLVVDDDLTWLKILEKMLKKCSYYVTTCGRAWDALKMLRDRKDGFDIVISDVNMPDMDGFKLLEHVGLEMDLPVIMMSVDGETSRVMKGVQHGACDYLLKPIRMKELKNIWQHVVRKRMHEMKDIEFTDDNRSGPGPSNSLHYSTENTCFRKRKDTDNKIIDKDLADSASTKKARVVWSVELHQKFVNAVNHIGIDSDKVGPKKILDLMNVQGLTRENVASHLQKYRLYLNRIRKGDKIDSSFAGMKTSESTRACNRQKNDDIGDIKPYNTDPNGIDLFPLTGQDLINTGNPDPDTTFRSTNTFDQWIAEPPGVSFPSLPNPGPQIDGALLDVKPESLGPLPEPNTEPFGHVSDLDNQIYSENGLLGLDGSAFGLLTEDLVVYCLQNGLDFGYPRYSDFSFHDLPYEVLTPRWALDTDPVDQGLLFST